MFEAFVSLQIAAYFNIHLRFIFFSILWSAESDECWVDGELMLLPLMLEMDTLCWNAGKSSKWKLDDLILFMWLRKWKMQSNYFFYSSAYSFLLISPPSFWVPHRTILMKPMETSHLARPDSNENGSCGKKQKYKTRMSEMLIQIH